ncbi:MAG: YiiD C-terminal domain-containing protein [Balneolales bacterium]|nr:YiiD C-terminal domain-containing protein [Balneolales bacterium]
MKQKVLLLFFVFILTGSLNAQELNVIYSQTIEAIGGQERWDKINTLYAEGSWRYPDGESMEFIYKSMYPDMARLDFIVEKEMHTISRYGSRGWLNDPKRIFLNYDKLNAAEQMVVNEGFLYVNNLINYREKGLELMFEGSIRIYDREFWMIRVMGFRDKEELYYMANDTYLPVMKQTYFEKDGQFSVVNYQIKEYSNIDGLWVPKEMFVTSQHLNVIVNFAGYSFNEYMERGDFRNPEEPDFTNNTLGLTEIEVQSYLHEEIPISKNMGVQIESLTNREVRLNAPISANSNMFNFASGTSVQSLLENSGWAYIRLVTDHLNPNPKIVTENSETTFRRPISSDFSAQIVIPSKQEVEKFLKEYRRSGRASIALEAIVQEGKNIYAIFKGNYTIIDQNS